MGIHIERSSDLQRWHEIYRYDGSGEFPGTDIVSVLDLGGRRITVTDTAPPAPRAFYRLKVLYVP